MKRNLPHLTYKEANFVRSYNNVSCKLSKGHHLLGVIYASQKLGRAPNTEHQAPLSAILHKQPLSKLPQRHACNH